MYVPTTLAALSAINPRGGHFKYLHTSLIEGRPDNENKKLSAHCDLCGSRPSNLFCGHANVHVDAFTKHTRIKAVALIIARSH